MAYLGTKPANQITDSTLIADGTVTPADLSTGKPVWNTNGDVGIGTASPTSIAGYKSLTVNGTTSGLLSVQVNGTDAGYLYADSTSFNIDSKATTPNLLFRTNGAERMRITSGGEVGINTTSPTASVPLTILSNSSNAIAQAIRGRSDGIGVLQFTDNAGTENGRLDFRTDYAAINQARNAPLVFNTNATERMRITSSGNLLVGTTTEFARVVSRTTSSAAIPFWASSNYSGDLSQPGMRVDKFDNNTTTSQVFVNFSVNNNTTACGQINANGAGAAAFGSWSDSRLKENIVDLPPQLENICALRPVEFDYIESQGGGHQIGFIAQEMQEVYPDAVGVRQPDDMLTITGWSKTEARLVKAIQELKAELDTVKAELNTLKNPPVEGTE